MRSARASSFLATLSILALQSASAWAQTATQTAAGGAHHPLPEWARVFQEFLDWNLYKIPVWRVVAFLVILVIGLFLKNQLIDRLLRPLEELLHHTQNEIDDLLLDAVRKPLSWVVFVVAIWMAVSVLGLPEGINAVASLVLQTIGTVFVAWMLYRSIDVAGAAMQTFTRSTESEMDDHLVPLIKRVLRVVLVTFAILAIIQQWGYDVTSLIAGLGIGGLAFALAAQDTLANWFGSLMIFTDHPFAMGDWIKSSGIEGIVEEVGLRSTKIRTFDRSLITVPNKSLAHDAIENFSMRQERRINLTIGLEYSTTRAQMVDVVERVEALLQGHELVDADTISVFFKNFGASSLDIGIVAFLRTTAYVEFMTAQQEIFLEIMRIVEEVGTGFAFPSQSVYFPDPLTTEQARP